MSSVSTVSNSSLTYAQILANAQKAAYSGDNVGRWTRSRFAWVRGHRLGWGARIPAINKATARVKTVARAALKAAR